MMKHAAICALWLLTLVPPAGLAAVKANAPKALPDQPPATAAGMATPTAPASPPLPRPPGGSTPSRDQVHAMIDEVARQFGVERQLVRAVVAAESNFNPHAVSRVGAVGLMQVMPATAGDYGVKSTAALFDPKTNLKTGTRHLKRLLDKYNGDYGRVIMAYNAGEGVVDRTNNHVTYRETLDYTEAVINNYRRNGGKAHTEGGLTKVHTLRNVRSKRQARRLLKKYLDVSLLSLKVRPALSLRSLSPALHAVGPESRPMFELEEATY
ncbi:MAG TPA: lytic transglycosylase domain-containing protein [Lamprocystis sp. (in: g-proteobacteria)]|nr:lytic transglycosylase domain-containing protein [Lamprocystis sp. (in: g-proteobacteria)]